MAPPGSLFIDSGDEFGSMSQELQHFLNSLVGALGILIRKGQFHSWFDMDSKLSRAPNNSVSKDQLSQEVQDVLSLEVKLEMARKGEVKNVHVILSI